MRIPASAAVLLALAALPAKAEDYYGVMAAAKDGNGYQPATVVAGWIQRTSFTVLSFATNGDRKADAGANKADTNKEWKVTVLTAPKAPPKGDDGDDDPRYLDRQATAPKIDADDLPKGPPVARREVVYSSLTCPALTARMAALKPLTGFEFNLPELAGNKDGANGDGHQGLDLWMRIGDGELVKSAGTVDSKLGQWFQETAAALAKCPAGPKPTP